MDRKRLFSILLVVFIDLLGFSLILPLLPYYAETSDASNFVTGLLIAVYALIKIYNHPIIIESQQEPAKVPVVVGE